MQFCKFPYANGACLGVLMLLYKVIFNISVIKTIVAA